MQLSQQQLDAFKEIHKQSGLLEMYTEEEIEQLANEVARYFSTMFSIQIRIREKTHEQD